jgi:hypothetical protein
MPSRLRTCCVLPTIAVALSAALAGAQAQSPSADVTFEIPLNLTNLSPNIDRVRLRCEVRSLFLMGVWAGALEIPVSAGQVVLAATSTQVPRLLVPIPASAFLQPSPVGRSADYNCTLSLHSPAYGWQVLSGSANSQSLLPQPFQLTPRPAAIYGAFSW